jgi:hypothetical protein
MYFRKETSVEPWSYSNQDICISLRYPLDFDDLAFSCSHEVENTQTFKPKLFPLSKVVYQNQCILKCKTESSSLAIICKFYFETSTSTTNFLPISKPHAFRFNSKYSQQSSRNLTIQASLSIFIHHRISTQRLVLRISFPTRRSKK